MRSLPITAAMSAAAAAIGGLGTKPHSSWYRKLDTPPWQPPPAAFPLAWTPLYALVAYGTARLADAQVDGQPDDQARTRLLALTGADLAVNAGWCWAFFTAESPAAGLVVIGGLDALNVALLREAWRRDRVAAAVLAPYVAWCGFATALNASIWWRNRR